MVNTAREIEPEPPSPQQNTPTPATTNELHWLEDTKYNANTQMHQHRQYNDIVDKAPGYTPIIKRLVTKEHLYQQLLLLQQRAHHHTLPPPNTHPLHIPTPKQPTICNIIHNTTWKNFKSHDWIRNHTGGWDIPQDKPDILSFEYTLPVPKHTPAQPIQPAPNITPPVIHNDNTTQGPTFLIQDDQGANRNVRNMRI